MSDPKTTEGEDLALYDRCVSEGQAAYAAGLSVLACCYQPGTYESDAWRDGYYG